MRAEDTEQRFASALERNGCELHEHFGVLVLVGTDAWRAAELFAAQAATLVDEPSFLGDSVPQSVDRLMHGDLLLHESFVGDELSPKGYWSIADEGAIPQVAALDFTRQFGFERPDGEQCSMERLTLTVELPLTSAFSDLDDPKPLWGCGGPPWTPDELDTWRSSFVEVPDPGIMPAGAPGWWAEVQRSARYRAARALVPTRAYFSYGAI